MKDIMSKPCYLCGNQDFIIRPGQVRDNEDLKIQECKACGLVFLSSFVHITDRFYENSGMHGKEVDIESWMNKTACDDERRYNYFQDIIKNSSVLDFGCGNGGFLLRAKNIADNVVGIEPEIFLKQHFLTHDIPVFPNIQELNKNFDLITIFHVLEHVPDPVNILKKLVQRLNQDGQIIIEVPNSKDALLTLYNCKPFSNFTYWSCHLFLFNEATLSELIKKAGLKINYIKQVQRYPISNHLYWLSEGKPGGHEKWSFLDSEELNRAYEKKLAAIGACDTILASISK